MSHDMLAIIWFGLWGLIWTVYFVLDAWTLGTGMLFPFLAKNRAERNQLQEVVGPFWNGNEVWLILAGGATFAAFPLTYANMFSWLYTPLMLILFALFFRAAGLEFMHKDDHPKWVSACKWAFTISSFLIAFLFGVAFTNLYYGLLVDENGYRGTLFDLLHRYGLMGGLLFVAFFVTAGALWIMIKTEGVVAERAYKAALPASMTTAITLAMYFVATNKETPIFMNYVEKPILYIIPAVAMLAALLTILFVLRKRIGLAFTTISLSIAAFMATGFVGMFPNMLPSRINDEFSVTLFEARGSELNLKIMFIVAAITVPIIIGYQLWSYTIFKQKITKDNAKGYH
jgi:cytochrome d ubiquinol oxidase subunit II